MEVAVENGIPVLLDDAGAEPGGAKFHFFQVFHPGRLSLLLLFVQNIHYSQVLFLLPLALLSLLFGLFSPFYGLKE